jgi:hypothetical protein
MSRYIDLESIEFQNYMRNAISDALDEYIGEVANMKIHIVQLLHTIIDTQNNLLNSQERMEDKNG